MTSYSFCLDREECITDSWNYFNRYCKTPWQQGFMLDIVDDCEAESIICPFFESAQSKEK